jgi:hypothetical protein
MGQETHSSASSETRKHPEGGVCGTARVEDCGVWVGVVAPRGRRVKLGRTACFPGLLQGVVYD